MSTGVSYNVMDTVVNGDHIAMAGEDMVAKWISHGTLNMQITGSNLSAVSWLTM